MNERNPIYLDHAATTAVRPEVLEAMWPYFFQAYGNPSSVHAFGAGPREALERAHEGIAAVLGCRPGEIVFTGGGTEADNLALLGAARALRGNSTKRAGRHVITSQIEHDAVLNACRELEREGFRVTFLPVDGDGFVDLAALERALDDETVLVSIMLANNEIGTVQPVAEVARLAHERGALVHTDAVQAAGVLELDVDALGVDLLSISAH
jgi:cysteine desulfurase